MLKLFSLTISNKLRLLACSTVVGIIGITIVCLLFERALIIEERQASVRQQIETTHGILAHFHHQQNAALVEEAAAAAVDLQDKAGNLSHVVSVFRLAEAPATLSKITRHVAPPASQYPAESSNLIRIAGKNR